MWASGPHRRQLYQTCARGAMTMRVNCRPFAILACSFLLAVFSSAQAVPPVATRTAVEEKGFTWTETYEGSGNTDGFITDINSTVGYIFDEHFSMDMGVPYLFVRPSSSQTGTTSVAGMGNPYVGLRYSRKGPSLDFSTSLNGAVPAASSAKGLSTGRVTFDWDNHFAHEFGLFTPFFDVGLANSVPDTRFLHRPYTSLGKLAHFEGGSELDLGDKFSVSASGYYILPWGPQQTLLNTYLMSKRMDIRRVREELITRTIQHELARQQSFTDPLTEIYNRHSLEDMAGRFISHALRTKKPLAMMMIDVDRFKDVNTKFGHLTGDVVLAKTAALLKHSVRGSDAIFRYGGDEFLVILADTSSSDAGPVMERITEAVAEWNRAGRLKDFELSLSIGVADWSDGETLDELLDDADNRMYATKADRKLSKGTAAGI